MSRPSVARVAVASIAGVLAIALAYAALRLGSLALGNEPDPALVMWASHNAMFWRLAMGAYAGGVVALLVHLAAGVRLEATARLVLRAVVPVAVLVAAQGILFP